MRILFVTHRLPYPPNRGDRIRAFHLLRTLRASAEVDLVSLVHDAEEAASADALRQPGSVVEIARVPRLRSLVRAAVALPGATPLSHVLLDSPALPAILDRLVTTRRPDVVLYFCTGVAALAMRPPLAGLPSVLDMVDVDSAKWAALGTSAAWPLRLVYRREGTRLRDFERQAMHVASSTTVVSERERVLARAIAPDARIEVVSNGVDLDYFRPVQQVAAAPEVVFCGVFNYEPNERGAIWLAQDVWPLVLAERPDARLKLVGMHPTSRVRALAADPTVAVTGAVPDTRPYLWRAAAAAAPLFLARGIQNKVLEALAAGLPSVVTPAVFEGLPSVARAGCRTADTPAHFARELIGFLNMHADARRQMLERCDLDTLSWSAQLAPLSGLLAVAARKE